MQRIEAIEFLPNPNYKDFINHNFGLNGDIINVIHANFPAAVKQTKKLAKNFIGTNTEKTAQNIWNFLKNQIKYVKDNEGDQKIKLPSRFVFDGTGDCKSYALFTAGILENLNIPFKFRYAGYNASRVPQHVYIVLDNGTIIDAVWNKFNSEKMPTFKKDYKMKISTISGLGCNNCENPKKQFSPFIGDIGKLNLKAAIKNSGIVKKAGQVQTAVKNTGVVKKASQIQTAVKNTGVVKAAAKIQNQIKTGTAKTVLLAGPRRAYRTLVSINFRGWASKLAANETQARSIWEKNGGSWPEFKKSIDAGKNKKPLLGAKSTQRIEQINGIGDPATLATIGSILALAAPLIALFKNLHGDENGNGANSNGLVDPNAPAAEGSGSGLDSILNSVTSLFSGGSTTPTAPAADSSAAAPTEEKSSSILPLVILAGGLYLLAK